MGLGIVGMHYTGMAAMRMPANLHYDRFLVALSVLIAVVAATLALWLAGRQQSLPRMLLAAMAMGLAIAGMHYTGMAAATFTAAGGVDHAPGYATLEKVHLALAIGGTTVLLLCLALTASFYDRRLAQVVEHEAASVRRADQRLRILFQGVTDYAIYLLDPMGHVASCNAGAQHIKGYTPDEIVGRHFSCFYAQEDIDAGEPGLALETALRDGRYEKEGWRLKKDGSRFWANAILDCIRDEDGALIGFAKVTRDMTDRRQAQWALDEAREQLIRQRPPANTVSTAMFSPTAGRTMPDMLATRRLGSIVCGWRACWRANASNRSVSAAARKELPSARSMLESALPGFPLCKDCRAISRLPNVTVSKLLKSCATPPVSCPIASIFCAWNTTRIPTDWRAPCSTS